MKPWEQLARTTSPDGTILTLVRHPSEWAILANGDSLMSSRTSTSEVVLGVRGCERLRDVPGAEVLIGGLGMGYTLRGALDTLPAGARVLVAELVPEVVEWNRRFFGALNGHPLDDPRARVEVADVAQVLRSRPAAFDAVILDVDNGPFAMTMSGNSRLYDDRGVAAMRASLKPGGLAAVWSAGDDPAYERRLRKGGFTVRREHVRAHANKGPRYTIFFAT